MKKIDTREIRREIDLYKEDDFDHKQKVIATYQNEIDKLKGIVSNNNIYLVEKMDDIPEHNGSEYDEEGDLVEYREDNEVYKLRVIDTNTKKINEYMYGGTYDFVYYYPKVGNIPTKHESTTEIVVTKNNEFFLPQWYSLYLADYSRDHDALEIAEELLKKRKEYEEESTPEKLEEDMKKFKNRGYVYSGEL